MAAANHYGNLWGLPQVGQSNATLFTLPGRTGKGERVFSLGSFTALIPGIK
jgi:hypothetical protein